MNDLKVKSKENEQDVSLKASLREAASAVFFLLASFFMLLQGINAIKEGTEISLWSFDYLWRFTYMIASVLMVLSAVCLLWDTNNQINKRLASLKSQGDKYIKIIKPRPIASTAMLALINYHEVFVRKMAFDDIDERLKDKYNQYQEREAKFKKSIEFCSTSIEKILVVCKQGDFRFYNDELWTNDFVYYCIAFVYDEATNGSAFPYLLNDEEFIASRNNAIAASTDLCEIIDENIKGFMDFGFDYADRQLNQTQQLKNLMKESII